MRRLVALLLSLSLLGACSSTGSDPLAAPTTTTSLGTTTTLAPQPAEFAVGRRTLELVDPSRPTDADPGRNRPALPDRTLPVLLLYPAAGALVSPTTPADDAVPADGTFPLVVFSHGWTASGPVYEGRLQEWARAGYVVAAPTFPLSSGQGGVLADYVNQPGDVSFVIDQLTSLPADDPLAGHVDADAIAAAGHSLGAITTLGVSLNSCCGDDRIDAAVELSGIRLPFPGGDFDDLGQVPFLAVHGAADKTVPVMGSDRLFDEAPGPAYYLRFPDAGHSDYLVADGDLVDQAVIAFLDRYLKGDGDGLAALPSVVASHGGATFTAKPPA